MPSPREIRVYSPAEITAIEDEVDAVAAAAVRFAAATGLRPTEWRRLSAKMSTRPGRCSE
jgi:hypothetical protein